MVHKDGYHCPRIFCDVCNEIIEKSGNVIWRENLEECQNGSVKDILFAHKTCDPKISDDGQFYCWQELDHFLVYLVNNFKLDFAVTKKRVKELHDIGL
jgi:hypothetical protein